MSSEKHGRISFPVFLLGLCTLIIHLTPSLSHLTLQPPPAPTSLLPIVCLIKSGTLIRLGWVDMSLFCACVCARRTTVSPCDAQDLVFRYSLYIAVFLSPCLWQPRYPLSATVFLFPRYLCTHLSGERYGAPKPFLKFHLYYVCVSNSQSQRPRYLITAVIVSLSPMPSFFNLRRLPR